MQTIINVKLIANKVETINCIQYPVIIFLTKKDNGKTIIVTTKIGDITLIQ